MGNGVVWIASSCDEASNENDNIHSTYMYDRQCNKYITVKHITVVSDN